MKCCLLVTVLGAFAAAGCSQPQTAITANAATVVSNGLAVGVELDRSCYVMGEKVAVKLTVRNTTDRPIRIKAPTSAPYLICLWRNNGLAWERIRTYPEIAMMVVSQWTLDANSDRTFFVSIPVEPDWPTNELLRLSCELNGRPDAAPFVVITVSRPGETRE